MKISVLINTLNEEKNIANCLETVKWADEIIIVDMYSKDKTVEIAKKYTDKIFFFKKMRYADPARQFALEKVSNEWILVIDADELVPIALRDKLIQIMENDLGDVIYIPHSNYFFGSLIKGLGWGPLQNPHPRFFKKEFINFSGEIHNFFIINDAARIYNITDPAESFIHFSYVDVEHFIEKMNRYTTIEAENLYEKGQTIRIRGLMFNIIRYEFINRYITLNGRKDGFRGISIILLMAMYRTLVYMKLKLMERYNSKNVEKKINEDYKKIALNYIAEYKK
ncbi:MAG: glycosyltransferase family 2 protein [Methanobacterium sp.]|uniref:glycosyltransferase family 2 protein n=1 Tax=Methanobacterium sp. TaxID=2164 RepID=UPI003D65ED79|nr:glycosyltransferase family 2 protein [Methanobacterium sp.]